MNCKYSYKSEDSKYKYPKCKLTSEMCPMIRYCGEVNDFISVDNYDRACKIYLKEEDMKNRTEGENKVRFEKDGFLYVELNDLGSRVVKVKNTFDKVPKYVNIEGKDGVYFIRENKSSIPKKAPVKRRKLDNGKKS